MPRHLLFALAMALPMSLASARPTHAEEAPSWATAQAIDRTRLAREEAAHGDSGGALRALLDAVAFDATYGPAYLALAEVYEARGDLLEADRALSMGIDHIAGFAEALQARGRLRARLHRGADAIADLEAAADLRPDAPGVLQELTGAYVAARALPAALAVARRRLALAEAQGDAKAAGDARAEVRALAGLVGEVDPVVAGRSGRGPVRHALWVLLRAPRAR